LAAFDSGNPMNGACNAGIDGVVKVWVLFPQMPVEERGDFLECLFRFRRGVVAIVVGVGLALEHLQRGVDAGLTQLAVNAHGIAERSEEHTSELQSQSNLVCRLLLEKKKNKKKKK